ncbi:hypothetical protein NMG60_11036115 [Bertholletia excelsa]
MDATLTAEISLTKSLNPLTSSNLHKATSSTSSTSSWLISPPNVRHLYASDGFLNSRNRNSALFLTYCKKADTDRDNTTNNKNSIIEPSSTSNFPAELPKHHSNQPISSSSSSSYTRGLVFDLGPDNSWDSFEIGSPVVKRFLSDEEERWYMWYHGSSNGNPPLDSIGLAVSSNGIHWDRGIGPVQSSGDTGVVMTCGEDWWAFDTQSIRPCEVMIMSSTRVRSNSGVYWLYYTGYSSEEIDFQDEYMRFKLQNPERVLTIDDKSKVFKSLPGLAMSQDGRHWARIEGEHHSGALFDVGSSGEWDSMFITSPQVVFHGNADIRMYYHSFDPENGEFAVGVARSRDGMKWVKLGKVIGGGGVGAFDEFGAMNARVARNKRDGKYLMVYEGVASDGRRSIGLAASVDGLKEWMRYEGDAVLKPSEEDRWDDRGVGSPCLVQMDGAEDEWRLYYRGFGQGGRMGIGMAVSEGSEIRSFRRWTGFHL